MGQISNFFDKLRGRQACPVCSGPVDTVLTSSDMLCKGCDTYLEAAEGKLRPIPDDRVYERHVFGAPTPWTDLRAVTFPTIKFSSDDYISDLIMTKKAGVRVLNAHWPSGCCICGKPSSRLERRTRVIVFPAGQGVLNVRDQEVTLVADGIPHCNEHTGGVEFDRIDFAITGSDPGFGLVFRSLFYRNAFRKLNPWDWPLL